MIPLLIDDELITRCPRRPFLDDPQWYNEILRSYRYAQEGMLTEPGTWLDQGAMLVAAFSILDVAVAEAREKQSDKKRGQARAVSQGGGHTAPTPTRNAMGGSMSPRPGR